MPEPAWAGAGGGHDHDQQRREAERFAKDLRLLRATAGNPSFRKLAGLSGRISHTTLHEAASGNRFASWETTREFVRACGGDEAEWRHRWEQAAGADGAGGPTIHPATAAIRTANGTGVPTTTANGTSFTGTTVFETSAGGPAPEPTPGHGGARQLRQRLAVAAGVVTALAAVVGGAIMTWSDTNPQPDPVGSPVGPRVAGDQSHFIADVTIPDGMVVETNETFIKVWEIQNSGIVPWHNRYLQREDLPPVPDNCQTPDRVAIGNTLPNERVKISVTVTAPSTAGSCMVKWKMVDDQGRLFFPSSRPVYFLVTVIAPD